MQVTANHQISAESLAAYIAHKIKRCDDLILDDSIDNRTAMKADLLRTQWINMARDFGLTHQVIVASSLQRSQKGV